MMTRAVFVGLSIIMTSLAAAQPAPGEPAGRPDPAAQVEPVSTSFVGAPPVRRVSVKSPRVAGWLSVGTTVAGIGLIAGFLGIADDAQFRGDTGVFVTTAGLCGVGAAAVLVGPSLGHIYAGNTWNTGLKIRIASLGLGAGFVLLFPLLEQGGEGAVFIGAYAGMIAIPALYAVGAGYEMATAPRAARSYNRRKGPSMTIVPAAGSRDVSLRLVGMF